MRIEVEHRTRYRFSAPVFLEPHTLRFRPRSNSWQRLDRFQVRIDPIPAGMTENIDVDGNDVIVAWFDDLTEALTIDVGFEVETLRHNVFDFLPLGESRLPMEYEHELGQVLSPFIEHESSTALRDYALAAAERAADNAPSFPAHLARRLHEDCRHVVRRQGPPRAPEDTLRDREGACRDLALLFVALCRELGLAARFVSGYCLAPEAERNELHAWAEVYLPGGGWRGFDPSTGLAVSERHIVVAAGRAPSFAAPVVGTFRGSAVAEPLEAALTIQRIL